MKQKQFLKRVFSLAVIFCLIGFGSLSSKAQLAKREKLTRAQVHARMNELNSRKNGKDSLAWEATQLLNTKKETYIEYAAEIFNFLKDSEKEQKAWDKISFLFPKSAYNARTQLATLLDSYQNLARFEQDLKKWSGDFREALTQRSCANDCYTKIALKLIDNDELALADAYFKKTVLDIPENNASQSFSYVTNIEQHEDIDRLFGYQTALAKYYVDKKNYDSAERILSDVAGKYDQLLLYTPYKESIYPLYGKVLVHQKKWSQALQALDVVPNPVSKDGILARELMDARFEALMGVGRYFEAFLILNNYYADKNYLTDIQEKEGAVLFEKLGGSTKQWNQYKTQGKTRREWNWRYAMIDVPSVDFELTDMEGRTVRSADLRGKVVVLDFWATWCMPCLASMPGMQAVVNKFKSDTNVVFLFVNTFERRPDYKEAAKALMTRKGYDFHVVFDNMNHQNALADKYGIGPIPTKIIIDAKGRMRYMTIGGTSVVKEAVDELSYKINATKNAYTTLSDAFNSSQKTADKQQ